MQNPLPGLASQAQSFIFGEGTDTPTYESLKRKRAQIDALAAAAAQSGMPRNGWEGATQTAQILASKFGDRRLAPKEDAERARAVEELTTLMGGGFTGQGFSGTPSSMSSRGGGDLDALLGGIAQTESGGRYDAMGPEVKGDRAYGKYQVMGNNIPAWTRETLGQEMDPQAFLNNPDAQEAVARAKLGSYMNEHGNWQDAASMWFSGRPMQQAGNASDGYNTVPEYVQKVAGAMGQPATMSSQGGGYAPPDMGKITQIAELLSNPYLPEGQRMVAGAYIQNELGKLAQMTPYQQAQIELQRDKLDFDREDAGIADSPTYGLTPIYGTDADGNTVILQASNQGGVRAVELPEGVTPAPGFDKIDTGTQTILKDRKTGETIEVVETDNAGKARDTAIGGKVGEAQGDAIVQFGKVEQQGQAAIDLMESIITDPALPSITGMAQGRLPPLTQGGTDLNVKIDQLKGKTFLEAFESLKGGGVITEVEGEKATQAIARLDRAQSDTAYVEALRELQGIIRQGVERMKAKVGQAGGGSAMPSADDDLFKKYGVGN